MPARMYQTIAVLAGFLLIYSAVAGLVERSLVSGPIAFTVVGLILGPRVFDILHLDLEAYGLRALAEFTLAMVLFTDAANADIRFVRRNLGIPQRLLMIGLPLTIILGMAFAWVLFPSLALLEVALLAAILAPTDAALGAPVVTNQAVPAVMRESLNLESGLNDGICVPVILILLGYATGTQVEHAALAHVTTVVAEEIGIGLAVGLALTAAASAMLRFANRHGWTSGRWLETPALALAAVCFAAAQAIGGSGFIACFVGGLLLSPVRAGLKHDMLRGAEATGGILGFVTWVMFGSVAVPWMIDRITWPALLYAALSLSVIRMLPVYLCLRGTGIDMAGKIFIGWFGPRGLASIVFAIIVLDEQLPGNDVLMTTITCTILLSVIAHGITANPLVKRIGAKPAGAEGGTAQP
jgi:NhaP-type Na+/H+ or K+/H+ antiporter